MTAATERTNHVSKDVIYQEDVVTSPIARYLLAALRIVLGWTFLWPFIDKLFGFGYGTACLLYTSPSPRD